ncbi:substrate-binding domain-containing protein [uncultured Microbacterium sp.]|uniref:substrate-binding domain-containing protein n=1 Tax=uncultured Microbacterium sp. TaxID=191216 RepID=UPI0037DD78FF
MARELPLPLTSVRSPHKKMGAEAVHLLLDRILGKDTASRTLAPTLIVRESSHGTH